MSLLGPGPAWFRPSDSKLRPMPGLLPGCFLQDLSPPLPPVSAGSVTLGATSEHWGSELPGGKQGAHCYLFNFLVIPCSAQIVNLPT